MTEIEARSKIKYRIEVAREIAGNGVDGKAFEDLEIAIQALKEIREYRELGTIEEFKALKEKNVAKKPIIHGLGQRYCPVCKCGGADHFYCARCGQKLG